MTNTTKTLVVCIQNVLDVASGLPRTPHGRSVAEKKLITVVRSLLDVIYYETNAGTEATSGLWDTTIKSALEDWKYHTSEDSSDHTFETICIQPDKDPEKDPV